jgi:hypothetical protein
MSTTASKPCTVSFCFLVEDKRDEEMAKLEGRLLSWRGWYVADDSLFFLVVETAPPNKRRRPQERRRRCEMEEEEDCTADG